MSIVGREKDEFAGTLISIILSFIFAQDPIVVSPSSLSFGDVLMGNTPSMSFTITANLEQTVTITPPSYYSVDVSEIAKRFGGGGHKKAAGFQLPGDMRVDEIFDEDPDLEFFDDDDDVIDEIQSSQETAQEIKNAEEK